MYKTFTDLKGSSPYRYLYKPLLAMKFTFILLAATFLQASAATYAQKVTLNVKEVSIVKVFKQIQAQTNYDFLYNAEDLKTAKLVSIAVENKSLRDVLNFCFKNQPLTYTIENTTILITRRALPAVKQAIKKTVTGLVTDTAGVPLPGVTIREKGTQNATSTDVNGKYNISVADNGAVLVFTFLGLKSRLA